MVSKVCQRSSTHFPRPQHKELKKGAASVCHAFVTVSRLAAVVGPDELLQGD